MAHTLIKTFAIAAAFVSVLSLSQAHARGGKEYFSQTYQFKQPMKGVEGRQGNFYCSYRNQPIYKEVNGKKVIVGHELFQHCY
jgi:hypothetical protein